jgi:hypothetical protein
VEHPKGGVTKRERTSSGFGDKQDCLKDQGGFAMSRQDPRQPGVCGFYSPRRVSHNVLMQKEAR